MSKVIVTRYLGPSNTRGGRVVATTANGRLTLAWDHALDTVANHRAAALEFARNKFRGCTVDADSLIGGILPDESGYAWFVKVGA